MEILSYTFIESPSCGIEKKHSLPVQACNPEFFHISVSQKGFFVFKGETTCNIKGEGQVRIEKCKQRSIQDTPHSMLQALSVLVLLIKQSKASLAYFILSFISLNSFATCISSGIGMFEPVRSGISR